MRHDKTMRAARASAGKGNAGNRRARRSAGVRASSAGKSGAARRTGEAGVGGEQPRVWLYLLASQPHPSQDKPGTLAASAMVEADRLAVAL